MIRDTEGETKPCHSCYISRDEGEGGGKFVLSFWVEKSITSDMETTEMNIISYDYLVNAFWHLKARRKNQCIQENIQINDFYLFLISFIFITISPITIDRSKQLKFTYFGNVIRLPGKRATLFASFHIYVVVLYIERCNV